MNAAVIQELQYQHRTILIKQRKTIMSNNNTNTTKNNVADAIKVVRAEIARLGEQIRSTPEGNERAALEIQMKELMDSIGMEYVSNPDLTKADKPAGLTRWQRIKLWMGANKKTCYASAAVAVAVVAGVAVFAVKKNGATVSSVLGMTDATTDAPADAGDAAASIFARLGAWIMTAAKASKDAVISGFTKLTGWVKNLFTTTNTEAANGTNNEAPAVAQEGVPAAA